MKLSKEKDKLKLGNLKIESFITDLDEQAKVIRGGLKEPAWSLGFCPSTHSFVNCNTQ